MIELMQLKQFAVFSEELTISAAAKKLNLSQPALSRSMQQFEKTSYKKSIGKTKKFSKPQKNE